MLQINKTNAFQVDLFSEILNVSKLECVCFCVYQVKVAKGKETLTAAFDQAIPKWKGEDEEWPWYSGKS